MADAKRMRSAPASPAPRSCKLNNVEPQRYLADVLTRLVNGWPESRIDELMPWHWAAAKSA